MIAVVGMAGSGKSTAIDAITSSLAAPSIYFGGEVLKEVERRGLPPGPDSERLVRESLRAEHGATAVVRLALPALEEHLASGEPLVVIDGVYSWAEVEVLRERLGDGLIILAVHAPRALRAARLRNRPVRPLSEEQLAERDLSEIAHLDKATPLALADLHVVNSDDPEHFRSQVLALVQDALA